MKDQILKPIENVIKILEKKEISKDSIDSIVAVGGSSSIPFITDIVSELMGNKQVDKSLDPSEAIAIGASIYGSYLKRDTFPNLFKNEIKIVDVVPMAIGIGIKSNKVIHLVNKNQTRPYKSRSFNFVGQQGSNVVNIDVYEGDSEYQDQCNLVQSNTMEDPLKDENGRPTLSVCIDVTEETFRLTVESGDKVINKEFITKSGSHDEAEKTKMRKNIEDLMTYHCQENEEIFEQTPATEFKSFISSIQSISAFSGFESIISVKGKLLL